MFDRIVLFLIELFIYHPQIQQAVNTCQAHINLDHLEDYATDDACNMISVWWDEAYGEPNCKRQLQ